MDLKEKIKVMQAYLEGKTIQAREIGTTDWEDTNCPGWNWHLLEYRIKPDKQPLAPENFPPGTIVREKSIPTTWYTVLCVTTERFYFAEWYNHSFINTYFQDNYEYSTDGGKTWKPCYK